MKKEENINETLRLIKRDKFGTDLSNEKIKLPEKEVIKSDKRERYYK